MAVTTRQRPTASDGDDNKNPSGDAGTEEGLTTLRADAVGAWDTETSRIEQGFFHLFRLESVVTVRRGGRWRVVTAIEADSQEKRRYRRGGK